MTRYGRSSVAEAPPLGAPFGASPTSKIPPSKWSTITSVSAAGIAALLLLASPELGVLAAAGGVFMGAVSAGIALTRPVSTPAISVRKR
jgi:hypothetical protein